MLANAIGFQVGARPLDVRIVCTFVCAIGATERLGALIRLRGTYFCASLLLKIHDSKL